MPEQSSEDTTMALVPLRSGPILLGAAALGLMLAGSIALWVHYGTAVFFEMIRVGLIACFG